MRDYIELGTTPTDEDCVQVSNDDYLPSMKAECRRFIEMLQKRFPNKPSGCSFSLKPSPHDFGTYYDVVIKYDDDIEEEVQYASLVEDNLPERWSDTEVF